MRRIGSLSLLLLWGLAGSLWAGNTHTTTGDIAREQRAWWGDALTSGYVVATPSTLCLHTTAGGTSAAIAACRAYVLNTGTPRQLEYVEDISSRTVTYNGGDGTYQLMVFATMSGTVSGWTRVVGTHYLWQINAGTPTIPSRGLWLATVTVAGSAITAVTDRRPVGVGLSGTFLGLTDTPSSYSGQAGQFLRVNSGETALEFAAGASGFLPLTGGTLTGALVTDNLGIEFTESDTNPSCTVGVYAIFADLSENTFKKCENGVLSNLAVTGAGGSDTTAIHDNVGGEIAAIADKATPVSGDHLLIEDSAAGDAKKDITVGSLTSVFATDAELSTHAGTTTSVHGIANTSLLLTTAALGVTVQGFDADLTDLADGSLTGTKVGFADPDSNFAATDMQAALAELDDDNTIGPNQTSAKVHWSQIGGMPAGFVDGTDDGGGGGGSGDVVGPASSVDNTLARFDGTTGKVLQGSGVTVSDGNVLTAPGGVASSASATEGGTLSMGEDSDIGTDVFALTVGQTNLPPGTTTCTIDSAGKIPVSCISGAATSVTTLTVAGTASEITSSAGAQSLSTNRTWTLSLPAAIDLGSKTSLEVPNGASPSTTVFGQIAADNNAWAAGRGALQVYDGTAATYAVGTLATDPPLVGQVPTWQTGGTITWETPAIPNGTAFPVSPATNDWFWVLDDSAEGACDSDAGGARTLCYWSGSGWEAITTPTVGGGAGTLDQAFDGGKIIDGADSSANAVRICNGTTSSDRCILLYISGTNVQTILATDGEGNNPVTWGVQMQTGSPWLMRNGASETCLSVDATTGAFSPSETGACDSNLVTEDSTNTLTNKTYNVESTGNVFTETVQVHLPFAQCSGGIAAPLWDDSPGLVEPSTACNAGTNRVAPTANFDAAADEGFAISLDLPTGWTGAVDFALTWRAVATTGTVSWGIMTSCYADGQTPDPAFNAIQYVNSTAAGTLLQRVRASISNITMTGCAATERLTLEVFRDGNGTGGTDSMTGDALGEAVTLTFRVAK